MDNLKVGYVGLSNVNFATGIPKYIRNIMKALKVEYTDLKMETIYCQFHNNEIMRKEILMLAKINEFDIVHSFYKALSSMGSTATILTIHDVIPLIDKKWYRDISEIHAYFSVVLRQSAHEVDRIIAISEWTKKDIIERYGVEPEKIQVIYPGLDSSISINSLSDTERKRVQNKFGIKGDYVLSTCTIEPRKNLSSLLEAYAIYMDRHPGRDLQLVLTGGLGWKYGEFFQKLEENPYRDSIILTGYVSDRELSALYQSALCFAYISYYEGFGLPILEAMACGKAVLCSNKSSMPEVGGDAVCYCDPYDMESIVEGLDKLVTDEQYRERLEDKARSRAGKFSYKKAAEEIYNLYEELRGI